MDKLTDNLNTFQFNHVKHSPEKPNKYVYKYVAMIPSENHIQMLALRRSGSHLKTCLNYVWKQ